MDNLFSCRSCGKSYKNGKSLRTHRYSYHRKRKSELEENQPKPILKRKPVSSPVNSVSIHSNDSTDDSFDEFVTDYFQNRLIDVEVDLIQLKTDMGFLKSTVAELKTLTRSLEKDIRDESHPKSYNAENETIPSLELKSAIQSNKNDIAELFKERLTYNENEESDHNDDLEEKDLIDDLSEVMGFFSSLNYEKVTADIPKLRKIFKLMLRSLNFDQLGNEEINLLSSISKSSKSVAVELVRDNFTQLTNIFEKLNDEIEKLSDSRHENFSENEIESSEEDSSSDSEDSSDGKISEDTDTAEINHDSFHSGETIEHADSEAGIQDIATNLNIR